MATAAIDTNPALPAIQDTLQVALQDLIKSCCRGQNPDDQSLSASRYLDVQHACEELRHGFPFHSEEGRRLVIGELTKLNGNYVVKIIRKGLSSLTKLYYDDAQTFENEAIKLVKLCCSQYSMQTGQNDGHLVASPSNIIDWTAELCDELMRPPNENLPRQDVDPSKSGSCLEKYLSKFADLYKSIASVKMNVPVISGLPNCTVIEPFKPLFEALKPRIHFEGFDELIQQTEVMVKTEENLDFMNISSIGMPKLAVLLACWISLLKFPFVTNWFALKTAKHDFLVHDTTYAQSLPFSDKRTYGESLIGGVCDAIRSLMDSNGEFKITCDKARLQVFFDNSEVFLRHTVPCFQLIQSGVRTNLIKEIFLILGIKLNRALLPGISELDKAECESFLKSIQKSSQLPNQFHHPIELTECVNQITKTLNHITTSRPYQTASFDAITRALLALSDPQQVLKVIQIWKRNFPDDASYSKLSAIFGLVDAVIQTKKESMSSHMKELVNFLLQIPNAFSPALPIWRRLFEWLFPSLPDFFGTLEVWQPFMEQLIAWIPQSCYGPEILNLIKMFVDIHVRNQTRSQNQSQLYAFRTKMSAMRRFLAQSTEEDSKSEKVKIKALKLGLHMFQEVTHPQEYEFVLNVILSVASEMETTRIKTYITDLLKIARVHSTRIQYPFIWNVIRAIDISGSIQRKSEIFECFLKLLQQIREGDIVHGVSACWSFFQLPVSINNNDTKRFLALAAEGRVNACRFILDCLHLNKQFLCQDRVVNEHIFLLFNIIENTLSSDTCEMFFEAFQRYMELQILPLTSIYVFEVVIASMAESIAAGKFDSSQHEAMLKVVQAAANMHKIDQPTVNSLCVHVAQIIDEARRFGKKKSFLDLFVKGLCLIAKLPLELPKLVQLMEKVTTILEKEKITDENELCNVMFHLFQMPNESNTISVDSNDLVQYFEKLLTSSTLRNVAKIPLMRKEVKCKEAVATTLPLSSFFSLTELLVERMPMTFARKTSASLYQLIVQRVELNPHLHCCMFSVVEAITKKGVSEAELRKQIEEIAETLLRIPSCFIPLIGECLRECYLVGLSEEQSVRSFILQTLDVLGQSNLNVDDGSIMTKSILGIPKQLVLTFKEAASPEEARKGMVRIFNVVKKLDPKILTGSFLLCFGQDVQGKKLKNLIQHDFIMLLKHTTLTVDDLCTALDIYSSLEAVDLLHISRNADFKSPFAESSNGAHQGEDPTPGGLAFMVIQKLRKLKISDIKDTTLEICKKILQNHCISNFGQVPLGSFPLASPKEYLELIFSIIKGSSYLADIKHWLNVDSSLAVQCKNVIIASCSWKSGNKSREEALGMNIKISETISNLMAKKVVPHPFSPFAINFVSQELEIMVRVLKNYQDEDIAYKLFELLCTSVHCVEACLDIVLTWDKEESILLMEKINKWHKEKQNEINMPGQLENELRIPLQVLPYAAKAFPNSSDEVFDFLKKITETDGPEDHLSLGRLPIWCKQMTDAGYDSQAIESWCTSLVVTQDLSSSDVDSIANLTPEMIHLLSSPESNAITKCLFCLEATQSLQTDKDSFKRSLLLARLLNEFACIAGQLKENVKVIQRIKKGVQELCSIFANDTSAMGNLYKVRYNILKDLFVLLFEGENGEHAESLKELTSKGPLSKSLVILFRRLARSAVSRPITFGHIKTIVNTMLYHNGSQYQEIQHVIHNAVLSFESNQDAIHTLQAAGYNQSISVKEDLWYSSSIQMSALVPTVKSFEASRTASLLRQLWREWKDILSAHEIPEVDVGGNKLKQADLFQLSDSLENMESQLRSVQQAIRAKPLMQNNWSYYRQKQLLCSEKRLRQKIKNQEKQVKGMTGSQLTKMVLVWNNQLLESVKMCSEKIPDCYAPNGFHSEKPVICGLAVDNRILTLYKQDGDNRTEMENVEVKLYPAGMVVFGQYRSSHPYDTEQMWAAFYKMLLDKHLVPKIFLTNVSPGFDWIKNFVKPEVSPSFESRFLSCCDLIPPSEDSFDYDPEIQLRAIHTVMADPQTRELIILTPQNATQLRIRGIRAPIANKKLLIKERMENVLCQLRERSQLQEMHPQSHENIVKRLMTPIWKTVEISVNGGEPTQESISSSIHRDKLLFGCQDGQQYREKDYAAIVLDAVRTVTGSLQGRNRCYDGCEHVEFL